jgi:hypothetical protein
MALLLRLTLATGLLVGYSAEAPHARAQPPHWAYLSPGRPPVPVVGQTEWPRGPIDAFILAKLERERIAPSPDADRHTLLRRASLVLTGLPPTAEEIEAYLADRAPDAYERVIDRLLASPRYGERMAVPWLDLARYADTHGYHSDSEREMWPWRDWVIDALNGNLPFDQFTIEQLAGDLLPQPTLAQRVATGLHRNHMLNSENGAIAAEYLDEYIADRVATTGTIWLGQTLSCARCHDHKYDPITQREFFQLYAIFHNVPENGLGGKTGNAPPTQLAPTKLQQGELNDLAGRIAAIERRMTVRAAAADGDLRRWQHAMAARPGGLARPPADAVVHLRMEEVAGENAAQFRIRGNAAWVPGKVGNALLCDGETYLELPAAPHWDRDQPFTVAAWVFPTTGDTMTIVGRVDERQQRRGWELGLARGRLVLRLTHTVGKDEIELQTTTPLKQREWQHVTATYDGLAKATGIVLYVDGVRQPVEIARDTLRGHILGDELLTVGRGDAQTLFRGLLDEVQLFARALKPDEVQALAGGDPIAEILAIPAGRRTAEQQDAVKRHFLNHHDDEYRAALAELVPLQSRHAAILRAAPSVMVMQELPKPRDTFVLDRGLYDQPGERVTAGTPAFLPPMSGRFPRNRLGLAQWLVDPQQPLTSRVAVNRAWQTLFGAGLFRTPDDFGLRGERPTHPELLDWLAVEYASPRSKVQSHPAWDTKRLHRLLVTSATFRQASRVMPELFARDPENSLWARGPRYRLPAEVVRDQALAAAGLLDGRLGGKSVRPYQPAELWRELAYDPVDYSAQVFVQSTGADLYRRSLYTFWKRTVPPPNLALFDAPDRETCLAQRSESHSPLQALVLLNDTTFVEAARKLAERVLHDCATDDAARTDRLLLLILGRPASQRERVLLQQQLTAQRAEFRLDFAAAERLLAVGESPRDPALDPVELAAWTLVASTVLNMDEAVMLR